MFGNKFDEDAARNLCVNYLNLLSNVDKLHIKAAYNAWLVYNANQKFHSITVSRLRDTIKIYDKSTILKISKTFILYNNNSEISKFIQVILSFFVPDKFMDFSQFIKKILIYFLRS